MDVIARRRELRSPGHETQPPSSISAPAENAPLPELKSDPATLANIPVDQIITVVSGLPRTGTSLMMQILEAAGFPLFTDGEREADESNRRGYYEHRRVGSLLASRDHSWLAGARGRAIKVVAPLLAALPRKLRESSDEKAEVRPVFYRVLFMERDMDEVLASQSSFLSRLDESVPAEGGDVAKAYHQQLRNARAWCDHANVHAMGVPYETLVTRPDEILPRIAAFLGVPEKLEAMRARIDPELYRARKS